MWNTRVWAVVVTFAVALASPIVAQEKFALVIGNGAYQSVTPLKNPANDASDMAAALKKLGFQVDLLKNAGLGDMEAAVVKLGNHLSGSPGAYGFFFYAGHGIQSNGTNYLIPVDAEIPGESFLKTKALAAQSVMDTLQQAGNTLNVVVLDACRDNPFGWSRGGTRGLSVVAAQPTGSIVVYATSAGSVAQDGQGRNGLFTSQLLKNIQTPGLEIKDVFNRTGADVMNASHNTQIPAVYNQYFQTAYLAGAAPTPVSASVATPLAAPNTGSSGRTDLIALPSGSFTMGIAGSQDPKLAAHSVSVSAFHLGKTDVTVKEFRAFVEATGYKTSAELSGGGFRWGEKENDWVQDPKVIWNSPDFPQTDDTPVTNVTWFDAVAYCNWLSQNENLTPAYLVNNERDPRKWPDAWNTSDDTEVTYDTKARGYRLPTEAEWEFAAMGPGAHGKGVFGGNSDVDAAAWYNDNSGDKPHATATKAPNPRGLYDMAGNVSQWCWDWMEPYPTKAQKDPSGPSKGKERVYRGGNWGSDADNVRSTNRESDVPTALSTALGFRVAISD